MLCWSIKTVLLLKSYDQIVWKVLNLVNYGKKFAQDKLRQKFALDKLRQKFALDKLRQTKFYQFKATR